MEGSGPQTAPKVSAEVCGHHNTHCYVFRVIDGRLTEVIEHPDTALAERVLDPPAAPAPRAS